MDRASLGRRVARSSLGPPLWLVLGGPFALLLVGALELVGDCPLEPGASHTTAAPAQEAPEVPGDDEAAAGPSSPAPIASAATSSR